MAVVVVVAVVVVMVVVMALVVGVVVAVVVAKNCITLLFYSSHGYFIVISSHRN